MRHPRMSLAPRRAALVIAAGRCRSAVRAAGARPHEGAAAGEAAGAARADLDDEPTSPTART